MIYNKNTPLGAKGFRAGYATQMIKDHLDSKLTLGKTNRQELINDIVSAKKGIFILREKYIRDVIQAHQNLGLLDLYVPHTEEYTLPKEDFLQIARIEVPDIYSNIGNQESLPDIVILLREPTSKELSNHSLLHFRRYYWSLIFHGEIHKIQMQWEKENKISDSDIHNFIEDLGRNIFEEIRYVLFQENLLFDQNNDREVFYEFIAYFLQFYNFAPQSLVKIFPILTNCEELHRKIEDFGFEVEKILATSRPNNSISVEDLLTKKNNRLKDPNPDLPIFEPRYQLSRIYESSYFHDFFGVDKALFHKDYGHFVEDTVNDIIDYNGIIGQGNFQKIYARAFRKNVPFSIPSIVNLDIVLGKQLKSLYKPCGEIQKKVTQKAPADLLQQDKYRLKIRQNIEKLLPKLENDFEKIEIKSNKNRFVFWSAFPVWLLWQILIFLPRAVIYSFAKLYRFRSPSAQSLYHRNMNRKYRNSLYYAFRSANKGNMARAFMEMKKAQQYVYQISSYIEIPKNTSLYQKITKRAQEYLNTIQEEFAKEYNYTEEQRNQFSKFFDYLIKLNPLQHIHRRLLQDIQKSYVDSRRKYLKLSFFSWLFSFGKKKFKTQLVAVSLLKKVRSLRAIQKRMFSLQLRKYELNLLTNLMQSTFMHEQNKIRERYRPLLEKAFVEAGIQPQTIDKDLDITLQRESIALYKMKEEILDLFVEKGYVHMTDLRDIISRNQLKMNDLRSPKEFILGDQLLKLDKKVEKVLLGVHHRGEIYMRMIHRVSSLLFGFSIGRWCAKYIATPFGGAYALIEMCSYIGKKFQKMFKEASEISAYKMNQLQEHYIYTIQSPPSMKPLLVGIIGVAILFFFYTALGRRCGKYILHNVFKFLRLIFVKIPKGVWYFRPIQFLYKLKIWRFLNIFVIRPGIYSCPITIPILYFTNITAYLDGILFVFLGIAITNLVINTSLGRNIFDYLEDRITHLIYEFNRTVFVGAFHLITEGFNKGIEWIERALYTIDDFFRFRQGENIFSQIAKAIFGKIWFTINYLFRFTINLIVEPQINPIKHFPIVTIAHKIILPFSYPLTIAMEDTLRPILGDSILLALGMTIVFLFIQFGMPGICGFMAWEFKENWKLYKYSSSETIKPVVVGGHGETIPRFLKPGFHSGTIPKLCKKIRKDKMGTAKIAHIRKMEYEHHHICHDIETFITRSFCSQFVINEKTQRLVETVKVGHVSIHDQSISVPIHLKDTQNKEVAFKLVYRLQFNLLCSYVEGDFDNLDDELKKYILGMLVVVWKESDVDAVVDQLDYYVERNLHLDKDWKITYGLDDGYLVFKIYSPKSLIPLGEMWYSTSYESMRPRTIKPFNSQTNSLPYVARDELLIKHDYIKWETYDAFTAGFVKNKEDYAQKILPSFLKT